MRGRISIEIARGAIIAAIYVALTFALAPVSYGPFQFRAAEALTLLPMIYVEAIPGLFLGCFLANIIGGLGPWDIFGGSLITLVAAIITYRFRKSFIAYLSPVLLNGLLVSIYVSYLFKVPYLLTVASITVSEAVIVGLLGLPLVRFLGRKRT